MDLGLSASTDFFSSGSFTPEEIRALINPTGVRVPDTPSAIQVLLNQGAEYLSQKTPCEFNALIQTIGAFLKNKSDKIQSVTSVCAESINYQNPLICTFDVGAADKGFIVLDWRLSYVLVDALLGGINGVSIEKKQDEPYSEIEKNVLMPVIRHLLTLVGQDRDILIQSAHFSDILPPVQEHYTRLSFLVKTPILSGKLMLELPTSVMPKPSNNSLVSVTDLSDVPIEVQAIMSGFQVSVADVIKWQVGTTLALGEVRQIQADLTVCGKAIASGRLNPDTQERQVCVEAI